MATNSPSQELYNLLITKDFDVKALDASTGNPPVDKEGRTNINDADMFSFDYIGGSGKNYGTVVVLLDNTFKVFFGDNVGRTMEGADKTEWFDFLNQLGQFAKRNLMRFDLSNLNKLKYTMQSMAAIQEGLFESYYGNRKISYAGEPTQARLMIKHNRTLGEGDARFRYIESLFIETADQERYKLPFKNLAGGRAMLEHVRQGGRPYDVRGQHIGQMVEQIAVLSQFRRANQGKIFEGDAQQLVGETQTYYENIRRSLKTISASRGYQTYFESWKAEELTEQELVVDDIKNLFVEQRIDPRIEAALPMLARIQQQGQTMKEAEIFENWINNLIEGTWALPETPAQQADLKMLMSKPLPVGADAINATEQLYDLVGDDILFDRLHDLADKDPNANCWEDPAVINRLGELGIDINPTMSPDAGEQGVAETYQLPSTEDRSRFIHFNIWTAMDSDEEVMRHSVERDIFYSAKKFMRQLDDEGYDFTHVISPEGRITYSPQHDPRHLKNFPDDNVAEGEEDSAVASALTRRIMSQRLDLLKMYGPVKVMSAIDSAAEFFGDVEEIGSSDMHAYMQYVEKELAGMGDQGVTEGTSRGIMLNGKEVDMRSLEIENVDSRDYPDFSDAYIGRASFTDGTDLSDQELDQLNDEHGDLVHELAYDSLHESNLGKDLDTDGVTMTNPSNMSNESVDPVLRLKQMLKH